jgi:gamma-glutamyltranspeptidase/glutathione hydrolase
MQYFSALTLSLWMVVSLSCAGPNSGTNPSTENPYEHIAGDRSVGEPFATRSPVMGQNGMAATVHPLATQIALDVIKEGGNAVDGAIAANAALSLMNPVMGGLGGDLYAIVWDPQTEELHGLNASGRSPQDLSYDRLREELGDRTQLPMYGPLTVSVPGAVDGWFELHDRFGETSMEELLAPTIRYSREGFPVTPVTAHAWRVDGIETMEANSDVIGELDNLRETFTIGGDAPEAGEVFRNPDLAGTLEAIASGGREAFYEGDVAETIGKYMDRVGGYLSADDLADHTSTWVEPLSTTYRDHRVYELPPNGQGAAVLQMLNILEGYDLANMKHNSAEYLHRQIEAKKLAFADRARFFADPAFNDLPIDRLLSKEYADERRTLTDRNKALQEVPAADDRLSTGDTVYLTVADSSGMMVSLIQSNFMPLGSGLVPDGSGFVLQNRGALFTLEKEHPNVYAPGKRPFHTIIPAFVTKDGEPFLSFGVMGGPMQPQGHVQVLSNIIDFGMNIQEAGDAPRYRHNGSSQPTGGEMTDGGQVQLEYGISPETLQNLESLGHTVERSGGFFGGYQAIQWDAEAGVYRGASEMRQDGQAGAF